MSSDDQLYARAERLIAQRDIVSATQLLQAVIASQPDHLLARLRLSTLATHQGQVRESISQLLAIAAMKPPEPPLLVLVAGMLHRLGESRAALDCLSHPALLAGSDRAAIEEAAQLATQLDDVDLAASLLARDARLGPPSVNAAYTLATVQTFRGELDAAEALLESCLERAPAFVQAHWSLSRLRRQEGKRNHVGRLRNLLAGNVPPASVPFLAFALFKELDDLGDTSGAWAALRTGCEAKRARLDYREQDEARAFEAIAAFPVERAEEVEDHPGPAPIFIVGMPRTGTTLLERILSAHPEVQDAGELDDFPLQMRWMANRFSKSLLDASVISAQAGQDARMLGRRYLDHAAWRARGKPRFTDKLPLNFMHIGLIARALPRARILHMVRNPMDTCFSNLKELFAEAYPHSYDQRELAAHYGRYRRLMAHWHRQLPGVVLDVSYEHLVADPESVGRQVLEFCGLDWRPSLVQVQDHSGAVYTASSVQVREAIHGRAVGGWRRYEAQLEPLRRLLQADGWLDE